jgi:hypothetical protein
MSMGAIKIALGGLAAVLAANPAVLALLGIGTAIATVAVAANNTTTRRVERQTEAVEFMLDQEMRAKREGPRASFRQSELANNEQVSGAADSIRAAGETIKRAREAFMADYMTDGEKLAAEIRKYDEQFKGKVSETQRAADIAAIREKAAKKDKDRGSDPLADADQRMADAFEQHQLRDIELEEDRERALTELLADSNQRRVDVAIDAATAIRDANFGLSAELIRDDEARGHAIIEIERAAAAERIAGFEEGTEQRRQAEADLAEFVRLRSLQLAEEVKPTWQRMLDDWRDTTLSMKRFGDDFMTGFLERGRDTWVEWASSGKLTTKNLTDYIKQEFLRVVYEQYLSQATANMGKVVLGGILNVVAGMRGNQQGSDANGYNGTQNNPSAYVAPKQMATGTNYVPYDGFKASLHKGEAVVPAKYNPAAGGAASKKDAPGVMVNQTVNVGEGVTRGEVYQAVKAANAELVQTLMRSRNRDGAFA